jgi:hypothetical protein
MIKKLFTLFIAITLFTNTYAQVNYVPNSSFEFIDTCYILSGTINNALPWDTLIQGGGHQVCLVLAVLV